MNRRAQLIALIMLLGPMTLTHASNVNECTPAMAMSAEAAMLKAGSSHWTDFYHHYKKYGACDDGSIGEGFSDAAAKLFANHWDEIGKFIELTTNDDDFRYFAIKHLDETDEVSDLARIAENAQTNCPQGHRQLCDEIWAQAKFPDVAEWLWYNARTKMSETGSPIGYYPEYDTFIEGDMSGNGDGDVVVAYTLEGVRGGTDWLRYVAVFLKSSKKGSQEHEYCCTYQIGGKGIATEDKIFIQNHEIVISTKAFVEGKDALCCPSKPLTIRLKLVDGRLVKVEDKKYIKG